MSESPNASNSTPDASLYFATVIQRLLAEPFGLGLALFLAALFALPSQIPDMIDPYFTWGTWYVALLYTLLAGFLGYTVWFWIVAAMRTESLIPGGRYYAPRGAIELGYDNRFGDWYRPFHYAANLAGLGAFMACMSRPVHLGLQTYMSSDLAIVIGVIVILFLFLFLADYAFASKGGTMTDEMIFKHFINVARIALLMGVASLVLMVLAHFAFGVFTAVVLSGFTIIGAFVLIKAFGSEDKLKLKRAKVTKPEWRFSWLWSSRTTALFFAAPHAVGLTDGTPRRGLRLLAWACQISLPLAFLVWLSFSEADLVSGPEELVTPIVTLLAITFAIGPMILFLSIARDVVEAVLILIFIPTRERKEHILEARRKFRERYPLPSSASTDAASGNATVEFLAYSSFVNANGTQNEVMRAVARFLALLAVGYLFVSDFMDDLRYSRNEDVLRVDDEGYDPAHLTYHIAPVLNKAPHPVPVRQDLAKALKNWHAIRGLPAENDIEVPVVIVAAAGGANRASVWSLSVLDQLNSALPDDEFRRHVFALSGVSGGALGSVTYAYDTARRINDPFGTAPQWPLATAASRDLLAPSIGYFFNVDLLRRFDIGVIPTVLGLNDRNEALEDGFEAAWADDWKLNGMSDTGLVAAHLKSEGAMPHLLLNGVDSRSGQRVITSTLATEVPPDRAPLFPETQDFFETFGHDILPSVVVMNSARFPLISPTGRYHSLDNNCGDEECAGRTLHQIIDGGYYENSGIETAYELALAIDALPGSLAWQGIEWTPVPVIVAISNTAEGVIPEMVDAALEETGKSLVEPVTIGRLPAYVSAATGDTVPYFDTVTPTCDAHQPLPDSLQRDAFDYAVEAAAIGRGVLRTASTHNHRSFHITMDRYCKRPQRRQFFHFGLPRPVASDQSAPMNWVLSPAAVEYMVREAPAAIINDRRPEFKLLREWFE